MKKLLSVISKIRQENKILMEIQNRVKRGRRINDQILCDFRLRQNEIDSFQSESKGKILLRTLELSCEMF